MPPTDRTGSRAGAAGRDHAWQRKKGFGVIAVIFMCIMIQKEKAGKPMFVNMDAKQAGMA